MAQMLSQWKLNIFQGSLKYIHVLVIEVLLVIRSCISVSKHS